MEPAKTDSLASFSHRFVPRTESNLNRPITVLWLCRSLGPQGRNGSQLKMIIERNLAKLTADAGNRRANRMTTAHQLTILHSVSTKLSGYRLPSGFRYWLSRLDEL